MRTASFCSAISLFVFASAGALRAQAPAAETERRMIAVTVVDKQGKFVAGLKAENFRGTLRGNPVSIVSAMADQSSRRIVLLIDTSGSMAGSYGPLLGKAWEVARYFVRTLDNENSIALLTVGDRVERVSGLDQPAARLETTLTMAEAQVRAKGHTALLDGMMEAMAELGAHQFGDAIVVLSDGADNASHVREKDVKDAVARAGVRMFFVGLFDPIGYRRGPDEEEAGPGLISEVIDMSGGLGMVLDPRFMEPKELARQLQPLTFAIANTYRVEVEFGTLFRKNERWKLEVVDEKSKGIKIAQLIYPHVIVPTKR